MKLGTKKMSNVALWPLCFPLNSRVGMSFIYKDVFLGLFVGLISR